jgi:hypothetical protein
LPKITAASAMKPRPFVMFSLNAWTKPIERNAPPSEASMPDSTTLVKRVRLTEMPAVSAASGFSPTERVRRPVRVRKSTTLTTATRINPSQTSRLVCSSASPTNGIHPIGRWTSGTAARLSGVPSVPYTRTNR